MRTKLGLLVLATTLLAMAAHGGPKSEPPAPPPPPVEPLAPQPGPIIIINPTANTSGNHWSIAGQPATPIPPNDRWVHRGFFFLIDTFDVTTPSGIFPATRVEAKFKDSANVVHTLVISTSPSRTFIHTLDGKDLHPIAPVAPNDLRSDLTGALQGPIKATWFDGTALQTGDVSKVTLRGVFP